MIEKDYLIAKELKERLSKITNLIDFEVFGSRARNIHEEDSDMDIFVEVEFLNKELREKIYEITWEVGFENFMVISPIIFTYDEVENSPLKSSPILKNISEDGVKI